MAPVNLRELERVEITILVDNYTDLLLLQSTPVVKRAAILPLSMIALIEPPMIAVMGPRKSGPKAISEGFSN